MYYGLIMLSVMIFGAGFALNDAYRKMRGSSLKISLQFSLVSTIAGLIVFIFMNGMKIEFTPFTFLIALAKTVNGLVLTFCGFKALGKINLSLYSLFMMLGGMLLPFLQGIVFFGEAITIAKIICLVLISIALLLTVEKGEKKSGTIYYIAIFVLNGMSGVLSKIFTAADFEKTTPEGLSILSGFCGIAIVSVLLFIFFRKKDDTPKMTFASTCINAVIGITNRLANNWLVIALAYVDACVQYPMVTGGTMIISTVIAFFGKNKPSAREILAVSVSFAAMLALFLIPV